MSDDREEFAAERLRCCLELGQDDDLADRARTLIVQADQHRYSYLWTWMGVPIIQMPADIVATQEIIWKTRPDVIIETGVARGGSVVFYASMLSLIGRGGKVIGIDIDIRKHNRETIESHPMSPFVTLLEGSSIDPSTLDRVRSLIPAGAKTMVVLDSNHSHDHVLSELELYAPLVSTGQYLIVADTLLGELTPDQTPKQRAEVWYPGNEPLSALKEYLAKHREFEQDPEVNGKMILSSSPGGYVRRVR